MFPSIPMTPGMSLTLEEAEHIEATFIRLCGPTGLYMYSPDFIRELKWAQKRFPDVRDYLESEAVGLRILAKLGLNRSPRGREGGSIIFMSRNQLALRGV